MENDREIFASIAGPPEAMKYTVANLNDFRDNEEYGVDTCEEALGMAGEEIRSRAAEGVP